MKRLLLLLLSVAVSVSLCAAPMLHRRPIRRIRHTHPVKVCRKPKPKYPSWQTVVAGGAATGTVVASYKMSNGVEEGIKTVAKEHPNTRLFSIFKIMKGVKWARVEHALLRHNSRQNAVPGQFWPFCKI